MQSEAIKLKMPCAQSIRTEPLEEAPLAVLLVIVSAIIPIAFVILLGVLAGLTGLISPQNSNVLAVLALNFCLPALLFAATATPTGVRRWRMRTESEVG